MVARVATGEIQVDRGRVRSRRLGSQLRKAAKQVESDFADLRDDARAAGIEVVAHVCDLELAKLWIARGQPERARPLLEKARQTADQTAEKEGVRRIDDLLART